MTRPALRRALVGSALTALTLAGTATGVATATPDTAPASPFVDVQLLALNDFHGNLEPPSGSGGRVQVGPAATETVNAGGAEYLATQLRQLAAAQEQENTITVAAGDLIGASPLLSAAFHDEPAIES